MLTENDIVDAVQRQLEAKGFKVTQALSTDERGVDLVAEHPGSASPVLVEAKGATSSKPGSARFGKEFSTSQVRDHVANAMFKAAKLLTDAPHARVVVALPDSERHLRQVEEARAGFARLGVEVWFVSEAREVRVWQAAAQLSPAT